MNSKKALPLILIVLFVALPVLAQEKSYDFGLYLGGVNYYGEVGKKKAIAPNRAFFGLIGKMNFNEKLSARATLTYMTLYADDHNAGDEYRANGRGQSLFYSFENSHIELTAGIEYTPFSFFKNSRNPIDFYVFGGIGAAYGDELYYPVSAGFEDVAAEKYGTSTRLVVPFGAGLKTFVGSKFMLGLELAPRYTTSDNFDGSHPDEPRLEPNQLPNFANNDWYTYIGITLTYRIGKGSDAYCDCTL